MMFGIPHLPAENVQYVFKVLSAAAPPGTENFISYVEMNYVETTK